MRSSVVVCLILLFSSIGYGQQELQLNKAQSKIEFLAIGRPSAIRIRGKGEGITGKLNVQNNKVVGTFRFSLDKLDTGIKLRNEHMKKKYLKTDQYPEAQFSFTRIDLPKEFHLKEPFSKENISYEGTLLLHGVQKPISGNLNMDQTKDRLNSQAEFEIALKDFQIETPTFKGISVTDKVQVKVSLDLPIP